MNDLELEELEAHLYSQVYHSNEDVDQNFNSSFHLQTAEVTMRKPNRYFQKSLRNGGTTFQNKHPVGKQHKVQLDSNDDQRQGIYSKSYARSHKPDISINQLVVFSPQQTPIVCVAKTNANRKRKERLRAKLKALREKRKQKKLTKLLPPCSQLESEVITVSDSDGDSCIEVPTHCPVVSVSDSADEATIAAKDTARNGSEGDNGSLKESLADVIFIEPVNAPVEIINIDEDTDNTTQKNFEHINTHTDDDTTSIISSINSRAVNQVHQERKELLNTPDSASNDFMHNVEVSQTNFNFSLHGKDFNNDKFLKPANPTETCETESSTSTTEMNTLNLMQTAVFNEIEFPKEDIFSETNLESFGNFITPLRNNAVKELVQSTPEEKLSNAHNKTVYSSDSSSESDYEDTNSDNQKELSSKNKYLPDLSPMHSDNDKSNQKKGKKTKNMSSVSSKFDLVNSVTSATFSKKCNHKKRKSAIKVLDNNPDANNSKKKNKNKKKKSETLVDNTNKTSEEIILNINLPEQSTASSNTELNESSITNLVDPNTENLASHIKHKKRKSAETGEASSNSFKKKKGKKTRNAVEKESDEIVGNTESQVKLEKAVVTACGQSVESAETRNQVVAITSTNDNNTDEHIKEQQASIDCSAQSAQESLINTENFAKLVQAQASVEKQMVTEDQIGPQKKHDWSHDDVVIVEGPPNPEIIVSSDSETNLSVALDGQHEIRLINCEKSFVHNTMDTPVQGPSRLVVDLVNNTLEEVQQTMSSDPKLWTILDTDRYPVREGIKGRRCNRCREKGHMAIRCPNRVLPKCSVCGESGHYEPRCPNKICTQCGERSPYFTTYCKLCFKFRDYQCEICYMVGHAANACPDLWRRYHSTTTEGPLTPHSGSMLKPKYKLWCSGCARSGHLEYTCRFFKAMYPPSDPHIKSYENVYQNIESIHQNPNTNQTQQVRPPLFYEQNRFEGNHLVQQDPMAQLAYPVSYQANNFVFNPFVNEQFRPVLQQNRPNFFNDTLSNTMQPPNQYLPNHNFPRYNTQHDGSNDHFYFENNLPNFISFDTTQAHTSSNQDAPIERRFENSKNVNSSTGRDYTQPRRTKNSASVFYSSHVEHIQNFINEELNQLSKLSYQVRNVVKNLKKSRHQFGQNHRWKTLNMVLFGIYKFHEGEKHLINLRTFKMKPFKARLSQGKRHDLYRSYCYIFGMQRHGGVDYNELLRRA